VDITPFRTGSNPPNKIKFASQTASNPNTPRIPQDLGPFITHGTITQAMRDDPNSLLRDHISKQNIISTTTIFISTAPPRRATPNRATRAIRTASSVLRWWQRIFLATYDGRVIIFGL
jgi:hypothetical protein